MEKTYDPKHIETHWSHYWETKHLSMPQGNGKPYCIMLPPPNVTGTLHMGHGFQQTLMDALIRHKRMQGYQTLWQAGTDHAGIATQIVVEQQLAKTGITRHDLGREKFIERVWEWRKESGTRITEQMRRLGLSIDWSRERFSMDKGLSNATTEAFIKLYEEGLIYRGKKLVNWDPLLNTAVSDLEVASEESQGHLWHIRYPFSDGSGYVVVATTRPETLLGDVAVAVHPDDERYVAKINKTLHLPLTEREIPIIADESVDKNFGTGCVKITPAHDFNDYQTGQRHQLPLITIFTTQARLNENTPLVYRGLDRFEARKKIIADLTEAGLLEKTEPHRLSIPKNERSGAIIEPLLTDQWFLKMSSLAKPAIDAVKNKKLTFVPQSWEKTYLQWLENIEDWCISRQLWWGHQLPVFYDTENQAYVGLNEEEIREKYHLGKELKLRQETDVLDTWFSASLWPFATLGWPEKTSDYKIFYPTQVLVTGFDIIFFWVARMVMMGLKLTGEVPFSTVYITGLIRDSQGQKMSKSKGNILDPIDLIDGIGIEPLIKKRTTALLQTKMEKTIEKMTTKEFPNGIAAYGTDALRFTFCALASTGRDINFDMGRIEGYRNFCNKLWNAARFVMINTETYQKDPESSLTFGLADRWIQSRLQRCIERVENAFDTYRFDLLAQTLYEFTWNEYCDWYLELSKQILNDPNTTLAQRHGACHTLLNVLEILLRLIHPVMPFITEEIWQNVAKLTGKSAPSIMLQAYPVFDNRLIDHEAEKEIEWLQNIVIAIRTVRSEMNISPAKTIPLLFDKGNATDLNYLTTHIEEIKKLTKAHNLHIIKPNEKIPPAATTVVEQLEIHIPLAGLINQQAELQRLQKEINKLQFEIDKLNQRLENPQYAEKAPKAIVDKEKERLSQCNETLKKLNTQFDLIKKEECP